MSKYSIDEQETHIHYDPVEKRWLFETNYAPHIKKLQKLTGALSNAVQEMDDDGRVMSIRGYVDNLEEFNVNPWPRQRQRRELSEEEKQELRERLAKARNKGDVQ